jgi:hypothetical protein
MGPAPPILINGAKGTALLNRAKFPEPFATDINLNKAEFMAASQVPLGLPAVGAKVTIAAWKTKPSYYIISSDDHMIPPVDERKFATKVNAVQQFEFKASHSTLFIFLTQVKWQK